MWSRRLKIDAVRGDIAISSITSNYQRRVTWETDYTQYQDNAFFGDPWPLTGGRRFRHRIL